MNNFQTIFGKLTQWFSPNTKSQDTLPLLTIEPILLIQDKNPDVDLAPQFSGDGSAEVGISEELPELTVGSIYSSSTVFNRDRRDWSEDNHKELKALGKEAAQKTGGFISAFHIRIESISTKSLSQAASAKTKRA